MPGAEIRVEGLSVGYGGEAVIDNVSFTLRGPGLVQVLGPNGAGKTTLLRAVLGLLRPLRGHIYINGVDVTGRPGRAGRFAGYVPQLTFTHAARYPVTVWEMVESALMLRRKRWPRIRSGGETGKRVEEVLSMTGVRRELWRRNFWGLSGGEKQRVLIARGLVHSPEILLMDEPLSAVDPAGKKELATLIAGLAEEKLVIVTSHDPMLLLDHTKEVILMNRGVFIKATPREALTLENTHRIYGESVIEVTHHIHICDEHYPA